MSRGRPRSASDGLPRRHFAIDNIEVMQSARLTYSQLESGLLDQFHSLVQDAHVRRYLMDGESLPREWSAGKIAESEALFARRNVGLWLAYETSSNDLVGFCGFLVFPEIG